MGFLVRRPILTAEELIGEIPVGREILEQVRRHRSEVSNIIAGQDNRWLFVVGPCSAWPNTAVVEYARRLEELSRRVSESMLLVMRVYVQKPRTKKGWTGPLNQPNPFASPDIEAGMRYCREMMREVLRLGLPIADEALFTHNAGGFAELLSWVAVGARSAQDQEHRIFASWFDCPVGMKNPTSGLINEGVNGVVAAQSQHTFVLDGCQVETSGNPYAHLVLRGGSVTGPNYHPRFIHEAMEAMTSNGVENPAIIIDASHDNAVVNGDKMARQQVHVIQELLGYLTDSAYGDIRSSVKGFMAESNLRPGAQKIDGRGSSEVELDGLSITDPCIGWQETADLVYQMDAAWHSIYKPTA